MNPALTGDMAFAGCCRIMPDAPSMEMSLSVGSCEYERVHRCNGADTVS